jgi:hypothetical protein
MYPASGPPSSLPPLVPQARQRCSRPPHAHGTTTNVYCNALLRRVCPLFLGKTESDKIDLDEQISLKLVMGRIQFEP